MNVKPDLIGRIVSGAGKAAFFTQLDWVVEQCSEKLGFRPFPGTLNLEIISGQSVAPEFFPAAKIVELLPPDGVGCGAKVVPIYIEGIVAALILPDAGVRVHGENIVEIIAPVNLRRALAKGDGDLVSGFRIEDAGANPEGFVAMVEKLEVEAVMLDLDGTIIDSIEIYYEIVGAVLKRLHLPQVGPEQINKANENGTFLWEKLFPSEMFDNNIKLKDEAWVIARELAPKMFTNRVKLLPGAAEMLQQIAARGLPLAVVTSTPLQNMPAKLTPLAEAGVLPLFAEIITADDTERKKPAADPLIECCRRLTVAVEKCVYVGDTLIDIQAGQAAGTGTVGVLTGFDNRQMLQTARPDAVIDSLADLAAVVSLGEENLL